jgi:hypothetical protein
MLIRINIKYSTAACLIVAAMYNPKGVYAQVDVSSSLILRQGTRESTNPNLDSGRYTVKPQNTIRSTKSEPVEVPAPADPITKAL